MTRIKRAVIFVLLLGAPIGRNLEAQVTAASCNTSDVQAAINKATLGQTVTIPAGTCTWTSGVTASIGISIIAAGAANTTITDSAGSKQLFSVTVPAGQTFRISSMTIKPQSGATNLGSPIQVIGTCSSSTCAKCAWTLSVSADGPTVPRKFTTAG